MYLGNQLNYNYIIGVANQYQGTKLEIFLNLFKS